jgi:hypothetical protein
MVFTIRSPPDPNNLALAKLADTKRRDRPKLQLFQVRALRFPTYGLPGQGVCGDIA